MKDLKTLPPPKKKLTLRQERFCQLYASDREFYGNGVQSYIEAYKPNRKKKNWYNTARAVVSVMLTNVNIYGRINEILEKGGLNDAFVDKQLLFLVSQHSDFTNKAAAIREYNKLKQRIIARADVTSGMKPISILGGLTNDIQEDESDNKDIEPTFKS